MRRRIFQEGGLHNIRRLRGDQYQMSVTLPTDADGRVARECPETDCSPGYFKVKSGTGITEGQEAAYCPYCRKSGEPSDFTTHGQRRYVKDVALVEAQKGVQAMLGDALGLGSSGRRTFGGGLVSIEMSYKPGSIQPARRPYEDEVRRDVVCHHCTLDHTVFGLATWCPDCGQDIFMTHVAAELAVVRAMLGDVDRREVSLGKRIAAKDLENCLEDAVSIFEASLRAVIRRGLRERGQTADSTDAQLKKLGNAFQSIPRTRQCLSDLFGISLAEESTWHELVAAFEKRHPIAHNLGVVDRKYLEKAKQSEREGREVRISPKEVETLLANVESGVGAIRTMVLG